MSRGRAYFTNNLINQGLYGSIVGKHFVGDGTCILIRSRMKENDAGLGNGGLGRLAALFFGFTFYDGTSSTWMRDPI